MLGLDNQGGSVVACGRLELDSALCYKIHMMQSFAKCSADHRRESTNEDTGSMYSHWDQLGEDGGDKF